MQPLKHQILFKPFPSPELNNAGLFIPENVRQPNDRGQIVQVGSGTEKRPMILKEGQVAYRVHQWGEPLIINNELHFLMDSKAIIAVE